MTVDEFNEICKRERIEHRDVFDAHVTAGHDPYFEIYTNVLLFKPEDIESVLLDIEKNHPSHSRS